MRPVDDVVEDSEPEREQRRRRDDVTEGESDDVLVLSRFAYKSTHSSSRSPVDLRPSRPAAVTRKDPPDNLADSQLILLSRCIGCELQWTNRKTPKQKRTHIEHCARKNALTKDTVRILIEKEIALLSPAQDTASSRIPANDLNENATDTLMDSIAPTGPVKKSKRQQVVSTVRSLPETRESILDRARDILGPTKCQAGPQAAQQFGRSTLARRNAQQPERPTLLDVNRSMEEQPPTQPFRESSLRGGIVTPERFVDVYEESSFLPTMLAQNSILSSHKRPASSPSLVNSDSRTVRRRLL